MKFKDYLNEASDAQLLGKAKKKFKLSGIKMGPDTDLRVTAPMEVTLYNNKNKKVASVDRGEKGNPITKY